MKKLDFTADFFLNIFKKLILDLARMLGKLTGKKLPPEAKQMIADFLKEYPVQSIVIKTALASLIATGIDVKGFFRKNLPSDVEGAIDASVIDDVIDDFIIVFTEGVSVGAANSADTSDAKSGDAKPVDGAKPKEKKALQVIYGKSGQTRLLTSFHDAEDPTSCPLFNVLKDSEWQQKETEVITKKKPGGGKDKRGKDRPVTDGGTETETHEKTVTKKATVHEVSLIKAARYSGALKVEMCPHCEMPLKFARALVEENAPVAPEKATSSNREALLVAMDRIGKRLNDEDHQAMKEEVADFLADGNAAEYLAEFVAFHGKLTDQDVELMFVVPEDEAACEAARKRTNRMFVEAANGNRKRKADADAKKKADDEKAATDKAAADEKAKHDKAEHEIEHKKHEEKMKEAREKVRIEYQKKLGLTEEESRGDFSHTSDAAWDFFPLNLFRPLWKLSFKKKAPQTQPRS